MKFYNRLTIPEKSEGFANVIIWSERNKEKLEEIYKSEGLPKKNVHLVDFCAKFSYFFGKIGTKRLFLCLFP